MNFGSLLTAMVTPFDQEGKMDLAATTNLVEHLIATGTEALVVAGTTGESPTLTTEEKLTLFAHVLKVVNGRIPVIAGTGSNCTQESIELTTAAEEIGVNGIMLVAPYYNKPSQEGLYQHFKAIAESTSLPVMIYNIPSRCMVNISVETIVRLSQIDNIVSVKEASGDLEAMAQIISNTSADFTLYSGDDSLTLPVLAIGGEGVVSVASHIIGQQMRELITSYKAGDIQQAANLHRQYLPIMKGIFLAPNPTPIKTALNKIGVPVGSVRLPLVPLNDSENKLFEEIISPILAK